MSEGQLPDDWTPLFVNRNDGSNEGLMHSTKPWVSAQFHPEAKTGPSDTSFLFDVFVDAMSEPTKSVHEALSTGKYVPPPAPERPLKKVLLLGSGGLSIGQAGEFDYSGAQAIKALKEEGIEVILINPNIASVQTNVNAQGQSAADRVYLLPVNLQYVEEVIAREMPEGIILSMGGQTGLNTGIELEDAGILAKYDVRVLGTPVDVIKATEDRGIFNEKLNEIDEKIAPSFACTTVDEALAAAEKIGYPCMIRCAFALGGLGSGIMESKQELKEKAEIALSSSPQVLSSLPRLTHTPGLQPLTRRAAAPDTYGCSLEHLWLQPRAPMVAAWGVYGYSCSSRSRSRGGRRSSTRWCATRPTTASPCATWRTSTRLACTPVTRLSSRRRRR